MLTDIQKEELIKKIKLFYEKPGNIVGGNLHLVLDDYNMGDNHIEFCLDKAKDKNDKDGVYICEKFLEMGYEERKTFFRVLDGVNL